jgi:SAM-dependent methyltransferase
MEASHTIDYGEQFAEIYDLWQRGDAAECVENLARLAVGRSILELGVGTGRIALPLVAKGFCVSGVDNSAKMLEKLRAKENGDRISIACGDFADIPFEGQFDLIYAVGWSFNYLLSQTDQIRCFRNVSRKLSTRGLFVIETVAPGKWIFEGGVVGAAADLMPESVTLYSRNTDHTQQIVNVVQVFLDNKDVKVYRERYRLVWPSELDLLAEMTGLRLVERWGSWKRSPVNADGSAQISIYELRDAVGS